MLNYFNPMSIFDKSPTTYSVHAYLYRKRINNLMIFLHLWTKHIFKDSVAIKFKIIHGKVDDPTVYIFLSHKITIRYVHSIHIRDMYMFSAWQRAARFRHTIIAGIADVAYEIRHYADTACIWKRPWVTNSGVINRNTWDMFLLHHGHLLEDI